MLHKHEQLEKLYQFIIKGASFKEIKNYVSHMGIYLLSGHPVPEHIYQERIEICTKCDFFKENRCTQCGCQIIGKHPMVSKARMSTSKCPLDQWDKYEE